MPLNERQLHITEGGRVTASLYPDRRQLWLFADTKEVRLLIHRLYLPSTVIPQNECNAVIALDTFKLGVAIRNMKG